MRVLVIGGTGFIGSRVTSRLLDLGHDVAAVHRGSTPPPEGALSILGERADLAGLAAPVKSFTPDVAVDLIAYTERDARSTLEVLRGLGCRLVVASSQDVYLAYGRVTGLEPGPPVSVALTEESPLRGVLYPYRGKLAGYDDYDKILVERVAMGQGQPDGGVKPGARAGAPAATAASRPGPATVVRLPMVYGPGDGQHRLFAYLKRMLDGRPAIVLEEGLAEWRWSRGYVDDVAWAVALAATDERAAGRVYNAGETDALSMTEWVRQIGRAAGWAGDVVTVPGSRLPPRLRTTLDTRQDLIADTSRLRAELGYAEPVGRSEGLRLATAWESLNPPERADPALLDYDLEDEILREVRGERG